MLYFNTSYARPILIALMICTTQGISAPKDSLTIKPFHKLALGISAGTLGVGGELTTNLSPKWNLKLGYSALTYDNSFAQEQDGLNVSYNAEVELQTLGILLDYHPFGKAFRISGGAVWSQNVLQAIGQPTDPYVYNEERTFSPERLGSVRARLQYDRRWMPYFGIGFGNALREGSALKAFISLGVLYSGAPQIQMEGSGMIAPTASQADTIQEGLNEFEWYPVLQLGLSYRFGENPGKKSNQKENSL